MRENSLQTERHDRGGDGAPADDRENDREPRVLSSDPANPPTNGVENTTSSQAHPKPDLTSSKGRYVMCPVHELRPHPSYARHKLSAHASTLGALMKLGDVAFE